MQAHSKATVIALYTGQARSSTTRKTEATIWKEVSLSKLYKVVTDQLVWAALWNFYAPGLYYI